MFGRRPTRFPTRRATVGGSVDYALWEALQDGSLAGKSAQEIVAVWRAQGMRGELLERARAVVAARSNEVKHD